ncbi:hypothetical protein BDV24DRAFT_154662 [Aspergillus arachidicola]|uniref:Enoyl reductase (ER) domain-containing protein n=1 Tax=Aspergillus arachidicola TaxID=656916 RepID=A0A5N6XVC9_9EURO|nr:hypothetical protein BDV24DRAFT_154662 [Aspergillus arachidicola]
MHAHVFTGVDTGLELKEIPRPEPHQGQVVIQVKAAGLCHSDCWILKDRQYGLIAQPPPLVLGHEVAGTIVQLGPNDPARFHVGDRVVVGIPSHPPAAQNWTKAIGLGHNGGYAQFTLSWADNLLHIPEGVSFAQAAVATDSIATAYHAVVAEGRVGADETVAVVGLGGLGMVGLQIALLQGATVYGIDTNEAKADIAKHHGATASARGFEQFAGTVFDVVIDFAGAGSTTVAALQSVRAGGRVVVVRLAAHNVEVNTRILITKNITLQGSIGASLDEVKTVLELIAEGKIVPALEEIPFDDISHGLERLDKGGVIGRLYTDPSKAA